MSEVFRMTLALLNETLPESFRGLANTLVTRLILELERRHFLHVEP
jgi:hypothetical protein